MTFVPILRLFCCARILQQNYRERSGRRASDCPAPSCPCCTRSCVKESLAYGRAGWAAAAAAAVAAAAGHQRGDQFWPPRVRLEAAPSAAAPPLVCVPLQVEVCAPGRVSGLLSANESRPVEYKAASDCLTGRRMEPLHSPAQIVSCASRPTG